MIEAQRYLYRADFIVPVAGYPDLPPVIEKGELLTEHGRIKGVGAAGTFKDVDAESVDYAGHILVPGLINCHTHLELSHLASLGRDAGPDAPGDIASWIRKLLAERVDAGISEETIFAAMQGLALLYRSGCSAVADIGNLPESRDISRDFKVNTQFFLEFMGMSAEHEKEGLELLESMKEDSTLTMCTAHGPYATSPALIKALKKRALQFDHIFPVHVAESLDEVEFLRTGEGNIRSFLEERKVWDGSFAVPRMGPVKYLDSLEVLDEKTLCVHCVHVGEDEIDLLAARNAKVCLCPGSNRYMGVGKAPLACFLDKGIKPAIGTDSLASNPGFSIWREMKILKEDHPGIDPQLIFQLATRNGAEILGLESQTGSLAPGCTAGFLAVKSDIDKAEDVFEFLTDIGTGVELEWAE